ncbi:MAG: CDP-alcohol phosphatidyltransferase family protein [Chloroflexota bacterium]
MDKLQRVRRSIGERAIAPLVALLVRLRISPSAVTIMGTLLTVGAGWLAFQGLFLWSGLVVGVAGLADMADGALARALGRESRFGAVLDSTCDRISESALLMGVSLWFVVADDLAAVAITIVALISSFLVSYLRARGEGAGFDVKVGLCTRPERVIVLAIGLLTGFVFIAVSLIALCASVTVVQRLVHVQQTGKETQD